MLVRIQRDNPRLIQHFPQPLKRADMLQRLRSHLKNRRRLNLQASRVEPREKRVLKVQSCRVRLAVSALGGKKEYVIGADALVHPAGRVHQVQRVEKLLRQLEPDAKVEGRLLEDELPQAGGHPLSGRGLGGADNPVINPAGDLGGNFRPDVRRELEDDADEVGVGVVVHQTLGGRQKETVGFVSVENIPLRLEAFELGLDVDGLGDGDPLDEDEAGLVFGWIIQKTGEGGVGAEFVRGVEGEVSAGEDLLGGHVGAEAEAAAVEDGDVSEGEGEADEFSDVAVESLGVGVDGCLLLEQSCLGKTCWVVRLRVEARQDNLVDSLDRFVVGLAVSIQLQVSVELGEPDDYILKLVVLSHYHITDSLEQVQVVVDALVEGRKSLNVEAAVDTAEIIRIVSQVPRHIVVSGRILGDPVGPQTVSFLELVGIRECLEQAHEFLQDTPCQKWLFKCVCFDLIIRLVPGIEPPILPGIKDLVIGEPLLA